jgi:hypothetical protein
LFELQRLTAASTGLVGGFLGVCRQQISPLNQLYLTDLCYLVTSIAPLCKAGNTFGLALLNKLVCLFACFSDGTYLRV